jgi:hypothetical protein
VCEASYKVSYHIAHCSEAHTIAENLIIPCVEDIVSCMLGNNHLMVIANVSLSDSPISRRMEDMSYNICELIKWIKSNQGLLCKLINLVMMLVFLFCLHL